MNRVPEENKRGASTIQAWRAHDKSVYYAKQQKAKDNEWLRLAAEQLRHKANSDIIV